MDEAIAAWRETTRLAPTHPDAHNNLGAALVEKGLVAEGIAEYEEAIRIRPNNAATHDGLGLAYSRLGLLDDAIAAYRAALRMMRPVHAEELALALVRPMRFARAIARAIEDGVTDVVIAGPGKIAQALVRANSKDVRIHRTDRIADRARTAEVLRT